MADEQEQNVAPAPEVVDGEVSTTVDDDPEVTLSVTHQVRRGREADFEEFLQGILDAAAAFPGYLGARVFRPARSGNQYRIVVRFDRASNRQRWEESEERQLWYSRGEELAEAPPWIENITGTAQERPLALARAPLDEFVRTSVSGIGLLLMGTGLALVFANSPLSDSYARFWNTELTIGTERFGITETLRHWVNDGLMALFFFILGLEIKREVLVGELRYPRQAALPIAAAVGGAIVPALTFALLNVGGDGLDGWGVPIGTDTAFALGIVSLLGSRVRPLLLVFLTAFSIVDDVLAVFVIAVFYTDAIVWRALAVASVLLLALVLANRAGIHRWPVYAVLGLGLWLAVFESGVHGTLAGVLAAATVPARAWINPSEFLARGRQLMDDFERACYMTAHMLTNEPQQRVTQTLSTLTEQVEAPLTHFEHRLNPWVAFGILPLFAFANAGIPVVDGFGDAIGSSVGWGVAAGLVIGKPAGITLFAWLAARTGLALLPGAIAWRHIFGIACLGGIGFTMSLFIAELAFADGPLADAARIGVLVGSVVAGIVGYLILSATLPPADENAA